MHSRVANQKYTKMKLTQKALDLVKEETQTKNLLASSLKCSVYTIERWIKDNKENGPLTTFTALEQIKLETGLTQEEILEAEQPALVGATDQK